MDVLRETIRRILRESRVITLRAQNRNDLDMARQWVHRNGKLKSTGDIETLDDHIYILRIRAKGNRDEAIDLINDRFGSFIRIDR